jgi:hypothetical protein
MKNDKSKNIATHIGYDVVAFGMPHIPVSVAIDGTPIGGYKQNPSLEILSKDGQDEGAYFPAQSIHINGADAIRQLRDFCDEILNDKPVE